VHMLLNYYYYYYYFLYMLFQHGMLLRYIDILHIALHVPGQAS